MPHARSRRGRSRLRLAKNNAAPQVARMDDERPITLQEACRLFGDTFTPHTLRAEAKRGRLMIFRLGKRDYVTMADLRQMVRRCREDMRPGATPIRVEAVDEAASLATALATVRAIKQGVFTLRRRHAAIRGHGDRKSAPASASSSLGDQPPARDRSRVVAATSPSNAATCEASRLGRAPPL